MTSSADARAVAVRDVFAKRAENVMSDTKYGLRIIEAMEPRLDRWTKEATAGNRQLVFKRPRQSRGTEVSYLREPGVGEWDRRTAPTSMREVEGDIRLIMNTMAVPSETERKHPWPPAPQRTSDDSGNAETEAPHA